MAEKSKNSTAKKNTAQKKTNSSAPKKKRPTKAEIEQLRMEEEIRRAEYIKKRNQTAALIIFAVSLVFFSIVLIPADQGTLWHGIRGFIFGLFGYSGFILPCVLIYTAIMMTMEKMKQSIGIKITEGVVMVLFISALMYVICHRGELSFGKDVSEEYLMYFDHSKIGWGVFGAIIGEALMLIGSSKAPAIAILVILIFLSFMFLTGFTLIRLYKGIEKPAKIAVDKFEQAKQEILSDEYEDDDELDEKPRKRKSHLFVYNEDDLLREEKQENTEEDAVTVVTEEPHVSEPAPVEEINKKDETEEIKDIFAIAAEKQAAEEEKKLSKAEIESEKETVAAEIENTEKVHEEENYILPPLD